MVVLNRLNIVHLHICMHSLVISHKQSSAHGLESFKHKYTYVWSFLESINSRWDFYRLLSCDRFICSVITDVYGSIRVSNVASVLIIVEQYVPWNVHTLMYTSYRVYLVLNTDTFRILQKCANPHVSCNVTLLTSYLKLKFCQTPSTWTCVSCCCTHALRNSCLWIKCSWRHETVLAKLTGPQLVKNFPVFHGSRVFRTAFTIFCSYPEPQQYSPDHAPPILLLQYTDLYYPTNYSYVFPAISFSQGLTKIPYALLYRSI